MGMLGSVAAISCLLATACGRLGFDPTADAGDDAVPDAPPDAALPISFVTTLGQVQITSSVNNSLSISVPTAVPIGHRLIVVFSAGSEVGAFACTDSGGNAYVVEATAGGGGTTVVAVCSTVTTTGLAPGEAITTSYPQFSGRSVAVAIELVATAPGSRDQLAVATANSQRPMTGATGATSQPDEILAAIVGWNGTADMSSIPGYYGVAAIDTDSGTMSHNLVIALREVDAVGSYGIDATLSAESQWKALLLTYPR